MEMCISEKKNLEFPASFPWGGPIITQAAGHLGPPLHQLNQTPT